MNEHIDKLYLFLNST